MAQHNDIGKKGEDTAAEFLSAKGHTILVRNYRFGKAEVDIVSKDGNSIVFTEVKTRANEAFGYPEEFVDTKKQARMKLAAEEYMYQNKLDMDIRFEVVSIIHSKDKMDIHYIKDAFFESGQ